MEERQDEVALEGRRCRDRGGMACRYMDIDTHLGTGVGKNVAALKW